jgi:hypothetical protein
VTTTVVSSTRISSGCQIITSSAYPDNRHAAAFGLVKSLVPPPYPLAGKQFGAGSRSPAFLVAGEVTTGRQHNVVASKFVLLASAAATGETSGKSSATPIPGMAAFAKVRRCLLARKPYLLHPCGRLPSSPWPADFLRSRPLVAVRVQGAASRVPAWAELRAPDLHGALPQRQLPRPDAQHHGGSPPCLPSTLRLCREPPLLTLLCLSVQYNVTVTGIGADGKRTPGLNQLRFTTPAGRFVKLTEATATGPRTGRATATAPAGVFIKVRRSAGSPPLCRSIVHGTASVHGAYERRALRSGLHLLRPPAPLLQYVFSVKKANCSRPPCPVLTFTSKTPTAPLTGLEPGTKVGAWCSRCRCPRCRLLSVRRLMQGCRGHAVHQGAATAAVRLSACVCLASPQYNVTVVGVDKAGKATPGRNMLQLTTPIRVHLESAKPVGATTGSATASTIPGSAFPKVPAPACSCVAGTVASLGQLRTATVLKDDRLPSARCAVRVHAQEGGLPRVQAPHLFQQQRHCQSDGAGAGRNVQRDGGGSGQGREAHEERQLAPAGHAAWPAAHPGQGHRVLHRHRHGAVAAGRRLHKGDCTAGPGT